MEPEFSRVGARRQVRNTLLLILAFGLAMTVVALLLVRSDPSTSTRVVSGIVGALAGALVGASVSSYINSQYDRPVLDEIQSLLVRTSTCSLTSPDATLQHLRKRWHYYHVTVIDSQPVWRYERIPFDNHGTVGALVADVPVVDAIGNRPPHMYKTEAAVWDRRLIFLQTRLEGDEAAAVGVFPDVSGFQPVHAGVAVMQSWSGVDVLVPTLLSTTPLLAEQAEGSVTDDDCIQTLEGLWSTHFARVQRLLPELDKSGERLPI